MIRGPFPCETLRYSHTGAMSRKLGLRYGDKLVDEMPFERFMSYHGLYRC